MPEWIPNEPLTLTLRQLLQEVLDGKRGVLTADISLTVATAGRIDIAMTVGPARA